MPEDPPAAKPGGRGANRRPKRPFRAGPPGRKTARKGGREGGKAAAPEEIGGPEGPEPTRYGDWEIKGRCVDF